MAELAQKLVEVHRMDAAAAMRPELICSITAFPVALNSLELDPTLLLLVETYTSRVDHS